MACSLVYRFNGLYFRYPCKCMVYYSYADPQAMEG